MDRKKLQDSSVFWVALGAAVIVLGGVLMSRASAQANLTDPWLSAGIGFIVFGYLLLNWALVLFLAHRHAEKHMCPDPDAHRIVPGLPYYPPLVPDEARQPTALPAMTPEQTAALTAAVRQQVPARVPAAAAEQSGRPAEPADPQPPVSGADNPGDDAESKRDQAGHSGSAQA